MANLLITLTVILLFGLPTLLVVSACMVSSRASRKAEALLVEYAKERYEA